MKRLLITTALPQTREFTKVHTLLGKWCLCEESQSLAPIIPYHWDDRALLMCDYKSLDSLYEKILIELSGVMNEVHGERNSVHYWRILLGPWLGYIIQISYDRWKSIEVASNSDVEYRTKVIDIDIDKLIPPNFDEFNKVIDSDLWNHYIYGKILNEFKNIEIFPVKDILVTEQAQSQRVGPSMNSLNWKHKLHAYFEKKLSFFVKKNDSFFIATYLPKWKQISLSILLRQFPIIYSTKQSAMNYDVDLNKRVATKELLLSNDNYAGFNLFLRELISLQIPKCYLEGYYDLSSKVDKAYWPKTPKVIFTSNLYQGHDFFKLWAAKKVSKGSRLIIGQHGGNYGMAKWNFSEDHQKKISSTYLSWGWKDVKYPNVTPVGQLKMTHEISKRRDFDSNYNGRAMLVTMEIPRYSYMMMSSVVAGQWLYYFEDQKSFIEKLQSGIKDNIVIRLKDRADGWNSYKRWKEYDSCIKIDKGGCNFHDEIQKYKVVVSTYNAATYLESMAMNIPTIIFWNPEYWELRSEAEEYMDALEKVGIFHKTPDSAARHLSNIWDNIGEWWNSPEVKKERDVFCSKYSLENSDITKEIADIIKIEKLEFAH